MAKRIKSKQAKKKQAANSQVPLAGNKQRRVSNGKHAAKLELLHLAPPLVLFLVALAEGRAVDGISLAAPSGEGNGKGVLGTGEGTMEGSPLPLIAAAVDAALAVGAGGREGQAAGEPLIGGGRGRRRRGGRGGGGNDERDALAEARGASAGTGTGGGGGGLGVEAGVGRGALGRVVFAVGVEVLEGDVGRVGSKEAVAYLHDGRFSLFLS